MEYRVNEKGKVFTTRVTKRCLIVTACVRDWIIQGAIHLTGDNRLKDELNDSETFVAVTDAQVSHAQSEQPVFKTPVVIVQKAEIAWIFPHESALTPPDAAAATDQEKKDE
jgi:hypothetical protein